MTFSLTKKLFFVTETSWTFLYLYRILSANILFKGDLPVKKLKTLLIVALCFTFMVTTADLYGNYEISPLEHYTNNTENI